MLESAGRLENTIVVMTGDNGWPFPRCKANLYDGGTRQPLAVSWAAGIKGGRVIDEFINLTDLAPTFLEAAGLQPTAEMTGRSFLPLLTGDEKPGARRMVFVERERHASVRAGLLGYPMRAVRTADYLYIRNFHPERWPATRIQASSSVPTAIAMSGRPNPRCWRTRTHSGSNSTSLSASVRRRNFMTCGRTRII
jgi:arylsulfatase A-like enzyme